ncbi:LysR family transcriptional regulator [Phreatobacter stygius]|uniref:LysR family transcriptional regulator n=1 Tax=Phreatobacter stygius TaxID=1940610 RepID=A0A4D7BFT8_9HYPH|nr:LysR family transcriptional regulator [Phreatobacter stygius]
MDKIDDLEAFLAVVEAGSLTAAARRLGRSLQAVSRSLATLEQSIGVELIRRTTRQSHPTDAGLAFHRRVKPAFDEIVGARLEAASRSAEPSGHLTIGAPVLFGPAQLVPIIARFMERHPRIEISLKLSDRFADLQDDNLDLAVRIGELPDTDLMAKRLGALRRVVFGAPSYFARQGRPDHPDALAGHCCIVRTAGADADTWPFLIDGRHRAVKVTGRFRADSTAATYQAVALGLGIGFTPLWQIRDLVDQGVVDIVLEAFEPPRAPIHVVWPASRLPLAKSRLFIDFLAAELKAERL